MKKNNTFFSLAALTEKVALNKSEMQHLKGSGFGCYCNDKVFLHTTGMRK
jgi:hypothetical protein